MGLNIKICNLQFQQFPSTFCYKPMLVQWLPLNGITLGLTKTDPINLIYLFLIQSMLLRVIWDLFNVVQFDPITRMISLTVIPFSAAHCTCELLNIIQSFFSTQIPTCELRRKLSGIFGDSRHSRFRHQFDSQFERKDHHQTAGSADRKLDNEH